MRNKTNTFLDKLSPLDEAIVAVCALRLDPKCSADVYIELIDKVVEAAKEEREDELARLDSP